MNNYYSAWFFEIKKAMSLKTQAHSGFADVPMRNRTSNSPLGGACYIRLTIETYSKIIQF